MVSSTPQKDHLEAWLRPQAEASLLWGSRPYIEALYTIQPAGPYLIGGRCFGGFVAFEMAQQLRAAGEEVRLLAVIDMLWPPAREQTRRSQPSRREDNRACRLPDRLRPLFTVQEEPRDHYVARFYPGKVTLFCNAKVGAWALVRWRQLAQSIEYKFVPGDSHDDDAGAARP